MRATPWQRTEGSASAISKYCKAAEYLLTALKYEKNPITLKTIREKCAEYTARAEA